MPLAAIRSKRGGRWLRACVLALALVAGRAAATEAPMLPVLLPPPDTDVAFTSPSLHSPVPVGVMINGETLDDPSLVAIREGRLFVPADTARRWGLSLPPRAGDPTLEGQAFTALDGRDGLSARLDTGGTTLVIDADHRMFPTVHFGRTRRSLPLSRMVPAQFLGYDVSLSHWGGQTSVSAFLDGGISGDWGVLGTTATVQTAGRGFVRLDSSFLRDFPDKRLRLVIGDTLTQAGDWNQPVRFAGIRLGTDFSLTPDDVTYPLPVLRGSAALPSAVELAATSSQQRLQVQPGDFTVDYQPVFTGAGSVSMTIRDAAGNARTVTRNFYTSPRLLRPGLDDFSLEAGVLRKNFGWSSFSYGTPFAAASFRHGLSDTLTVFGRAEADTDTQAIGFGSGLVIPPIGEFSLAAAASHSSWGSGTLWRAQFQRITAIYSISASYQKESANFSQVGAARLDGEDRSELVIAGSLALGRFGSISASHAENTQGENMHYSISAISLASNVGRAYLSLSARETDSAGERDRGLFAAITLPLGPRTSTSVFVDGSRTTATLTRNLPSDQGLGFRALVSRDGGGGLTQAEGAVSWRSGVGDVELSALHQGNTDGVRLRATGAFLMAGGQVAATQRLDSAFAVVEVAGEDKAHLYFENRPVAQEAGGGKRAIITGLQPYAGNRVAVDLDDLPLDTEVTFSEKRVVPGYRQAVEVHFGRAATHPMTITLTDNHGAVLPPGLAVSVTGAPDGVTGYDSKIYLSDAQPGTMVTVRGPAMRCRAAVPERTAGMAPVRCMPIEGGDDR